MKRQLICKLTAAVAVAGFALSAQAVPVVPAINFDQADGQLAGGTLSYDGAGGALIGEGISFDWIRGDKTPENANTRLDCVGCKLSFTTGANRSEGPDMWVFDGGGDFTLSGKVMDGSDEVAHGDLINGQFTATGHTPSVSYEASVGQLVLDAFGTDTKDPGLSDFFGLDSDSTFNFILTGESLQTDFNSDGSFTVTVDNADLIDNLSTTAVPEPGAMGTFGVGIFLVALGLFLHRRRYGPKLC